MTTVTVHGRNSISNTNLQQQQSGTKKTHHMRRELYIFEQSGKKDLERRRVLHRGTDSE